MKDMNSIKIIGVDHGYGNIKTANCCFLSGVAAFDEKPPVGYDLLLYDGRYYLIGALHKTYSGVKVIDGDYYILTLAAIARELRREELTSAKVYLAVGLPLSWVTTQNKAFRDYLLKNESADFTYRDIDYHIEFAGCEVFPQGFAAVASRSGTFAVWVSRGGDYGTGALSDDRVIGRLFFCGKCTHRRSHDQTEMECNEQIQEEMLCGSACYGCGEHQLQYRELRGECGNLGKRTGDRRLRGAAGGDSGSEASDRIDKG